MPTEIVIAGAPVSGADIFDMRITKSGGKVVQLFRTIIRGITLNVFPMIGTDSARLLRCFSSVVNADSEKIIRGEGATGSLTVHYSFD